MLGEINTVVRSAGDSIADAARHKVHARSTEGVATGDALKAKPSATSGSMQGDRLSAVS